MLIFLSHHTSEILTFALVLCRIGGLAATAPLLGLSAVPLQFRILLSVVLAVLLAPLYWAAPIRGAGTAADCLLLAGGEVLIGAVLGTGVAILLSAALMAGRLISQASGIALADVLSPGLDEAVPVHAHLLYLVTLTVFIAMGGHRLAIGALLETFDGLPPGTAVIPATLAQTTVALVSESFQLAIRAAAPALTALLLSTIVLGILGRTLPQLNILSLGFGVNVMATLLVLAVSLGAIAYLTSDQIGPALDAAVQCVTGRP